MSLGIMHQEQQSLTRMADPSGDEPVKDGPNKRKGSSDFQLEVMEDGSAVIPPTIEMKTVQDKQEFIQQFFAHSYGRVFTWKRHLTT